MRFGRTTISFSWPSWSGPRRFRAARAAPALAIVAAVVLAAAVGPVPIVIGAVAGSALMALCRCLDPEDAYNAIDWKALSASDSLRVSSRPFLMAVAFAASVSFMTPVGYQTNTIIYGPGQYRFADFLRVGTPLNVLVWIVATIAIRWFWPLRP